HDVLASTRRLERFRQKITEVIEQPLGAAELDVSSSAIRNLATHESVPSRRETRQGADWNPMCGSNRRADIFHEARLVTRAQRGPAVLERETRKLLGDQIWPLVVAYAFGE